VTLRLTEEQLEIRALAREFAAGEIRPHAAEWDARRELDLQVFSKLGELGFMGMRAPEEYGGLDFDLATYLLVLEELAWGDASVSLGVAIHSGPVTGLLRRYGTDAQKDRYLPRLASGEIIGAFALSEAGAGSDAQSLQASFTREGEELILSGEKKWVTNGGRGGLLILFARESGRGRISAFLLDPELHQFEVGKREVTMGLAASETVEVHLDGTALNDEALLGEEGEGFTYAMEAMVVGRLGISAQATGIARAAFEHAREYADERMQFGRRLLDFQATRFKLAEMATKIASARALSFRVAEAMEGPVDPEAPSSATLAAMAKLTASEAAVWTADEAVQIFGGYGYMRHYPVERLLRDAKGTEIYEGTNEIMRLVIAREAAGPLEA
jgi:alkylation response protein AidB-like acyl-CoA dehydrogenase